MNILVVDDNHDAADSLAMLLTIWGYNVRTVYDGADVPDATEEFQPDCIFLDVNMPVIDGFAAARRLRSNPDLKRVLLIALTAYSDTDRLNRLLDAGFNFYLKKPAEPLRIRHVLEEIEERMQLSTTRDDQGVY